MPALVSLCSTQRLIRIRNRRPTRRHVGQVGESITITLTELAELLKESFSEEKFESVNRTNGCWPLGTVLPP